MTPDGDRRHRPESGCVVDEVPSLVGNENVVSVLVLGEDTFHSQRWLDGASPIEGSFQGVAVELAAARVPQGLVAGIDPSETMLTMARWRNRKAFEARRVELRHGTVSNLPFDDATFDACVRPRRRHSSWGFKHDRERFGYGLAFRKQRSTCIIGRIDAARVVTTRLDDDALVWGVVELSHVANKGEPSRQSRAALRQCRA